MKVLHDMKTLREMYLAQPVPKGYRELHEADIVPEGVKYFMLDYYPFGIESSADYNDVSNVRFPINDIGLRYFVKEEKDNDTITEGIQIFD
jgi:hypothetical protein